MPTLEGIGLAFAIGLVIGLVVDTVTPGRVIFGWLLAIILGFIGAAVGGFVFVTFAVADLVVGGLAVAPAIIGALVLVLVAKLIISLATRRPKP
ncbi:MAG: GlsB/YeaQ/YmgE family stress response membrane protein [Dehalococcoidales bacterium]|nr:GlsB/YeaQ/YmgE family stress response membrane protein [Dehalococcoidales bacterium]